MPFANDVATCSACGRKTKHHVTVKSRNGAMKVYGPDCARKMLSLAKKVRERSEQLTTSFSRESTMPVDLANMDKLLPDMAAVKKAASKLDKLPPGLRKAAAARLVARAKALGGSLDLSVDVAQRKTAKTAGLTLPGTTKLPLAGPDGKFSRQRAQAAVRLAGHVKGTDYAVVKKWLVAKLRANGAADLIPKAWTS